MILYGSIISYLNNNDSIKELCKTIQDNSLLFDIHPDSFKLLLQDSNKEMVIVPNFGFIDQLISQEELETAFNDLLKQIDIEYILVCYADDKIKLSIKKKIKKVRKNLYLPKADIDMMTADKLEESRYEREEE